MLLYYLLLGLILIFPFLYIARVSGQKTKHKKRLLKGSDIETLTQYFLNMCLSVTLGIQTSPLPFIITTFVVVSLLLVYSFIEGDSEVSCGHLSMKKVNNIVHKLTFWLYNLVFLGMYLLVIVKEESQDELLRSDLQSYG